MILNAYFESNFFFFFPRVGASNVVFPSENS